MDTGVVSFEGIPGAGKTTVINNLKRVPGLKDVHFLTESLDIWNSLKLPTGESLFELYNTKPKERSSIFQIMALASGIDSTQKALKDHHINILSERSIVTNRLFAENKFERGFLDPIEWGVYQYLHDVMTKNESLHPKMSVYLRLDPEEAHARVLARDRVGEALTLEDLKVLHKKHDEWADLHKDRVLVIDVSGLTESEVITAVLDRLFV